MGTYTVVANNDFRNEGWTVNGTSVNDLTDAWNNDDDSKYASCPGNRGRAAIRFPVDISASDIPAGAAITSVTVKIRVRKTVNDSKSVTVNVLTTDDTSRYTSRTLYPTTSFADYEVGTYTVDPLGNAWDKDRLNRLAVQVFSYSVPPNDGVRVSKLYAVVNYKERPTVKVTAPTGTVTSPSPRLTWTYAQEDGDLQKSAQYKLFTASQVNATDFNADTAQAVYVGSVEGDITSLGLPTALAPDAYYVFVKATSVFDSVSAWNSRAFTVTGASPGVPGGGVGGIGTGGGGGFERVIADSVTSNAFLTLRDGSNLLSVQQASFETPGDALGYAGANATLAYDANVFYQGVGSMSVTATAAGDASATTEFIEVAPGADVTAVAQLKAASDVRTVSVSMLFYDETFTAIPGSTITGSDTDSATSWKEITCTGTAPTAEDTTVYVKLEIKIEGAAAGEVHNVDQVGVMYGTNSVWSHGGHMSRNILSSAASTADEPIDALAEPWEAASASSYARTTSSGTGANGAKMFTMTYEGIDPTIAVVATGTPYNSTTDGTGYTLNKPTGAGAGHVLVAYVAADTGEAITPPDGWTLVNSATAGVGNTRSGLWVMVKDGAADDPSTWVGTLGATCSRVRASVVAYSGAAAAEDQFPVEGVRESASTSPVAQAPTLSNSDAGAWRLSAFALRDDTSTEGSMTANVLPPSAVPPIEYVGASPNWWYGGAQSTYQINRPSGVQADDLMIAFGAFSGTATPTPPTGWVQVNRKVSDNGNGDDHSGTLTFVVWKRTAGSSEPTSWGSSYTGSGTPLMTQAVAYRYCDTAANQFIDQGMSTSGDYDLYTPTVENTDSNAWRVSAYAFTTAFGERTSSTENKERTDNRTDVGAHPDVQIGVYDSNGKISTGNTRTYGYVTNYESAWAGCGWIGILKPATAVSAGANESERADDGAAASSKAIHLGVYDSGDVAGTGTQTVYGNYAPSSGTEIGSSCSWMGFLVPAAPQTAGEVGANLVEEVDISAVSQEVIARSGGKVTYQAAFLGSTAGQPFLKLYFYNANELIATRIAAGQSFNTDTWVKSVASFDIPAGTTRIGCGVTATDREVNDTVHFDRVSLAFGEGSVWRNGTSRAEHPIFGVPVIEYAEDTGAGYGDWSPLFGTGRALLKYDQLTGLVTYVDQTLTPLASRKYRARTVTHGLDGDVFASGYGAESAEISLVAAEWWIKDPTDPAQALQVKVKSEPFGVTTASTAAVFQALGADLPVVLTEGYKGDTFTITVICDRLKYAAIRKLLNSRKTLFLQSNLDNAWWVRPIGDIGSDTQETGKRHSDPLRFVKLTFTQVDPVE